MSTSVFIVYGHDSYECGTEVGAFLSAEKAEAFAQSLRDYDNTKPSIDPFTDFKYLRLERWEKKHPSGARSHETWGVHELPLMDAPK